MGYLESMQMVRVDIPADLVVAALGRGQPLDGGDQAPRIGTLPGGQGLSGTRRRTLPFAN